MAALDVTQSAAFQRQLLSENGAQCVAFKVNGEINLCEFQSLRDRAGVNKSVF